MDKKNTMCNPKGGVTEEAAEALDLLKSFCDKRQNALKCNNLDCMCCPVNSCYPILQGEAKATQPLTDTELENLIWNEPSDWLRAIRYMFSQGIPAFGFRTGDALAASDVADFLCVADRVAINIAIDEINSALDCPLCGGYTPTDEYRQKLDCLDNEIRTFYRNKLVGF